MRQTQYIILLFLVAVALTAGCTGKDEGTSRIAQPTDTFYTKQTAMDIFAYQPERALQIIDSAVIVGNMDKVQADQCRARIYSYTQMHNQADSLLGGTKDIRLDSAQAIGERLLSHDSIKTNLKRLQDVLEILAYTERMQNDTLGWIRRLRELVGVYHQIGPEAEADVLRTEAEIGAALCAIGQEKEGMAKMDSVIAILSEKVSFNALDALIIALKRKIVYLSSQDRYAETLPLLHHIFERLDDYEAHPGDLMMVYSERMAAEIERHDMCWYRTDVHVELCTHPGYTADTCPYHKH